MAGAAQPLITAALGVNLALVLVEAQQVQVPLALLPRAQRVLALLVLTAPVAERLEISVKVPPLEIAVVLMVGVDQLLLIAVQDARVHSELAPLRWRIGGQK